MADNAPSYVTKVKPVNVSFRLDPTDMEDVAIERILSDWADKQEKTKNIKAAIGVYHALQRGDIQYFEDNHAPFINEIQLAGRKELQEQIDDLQQTVAMLTAQLNSCMMQLQDNQLVIDAHSSKIARNTTGLIGCYRMIKEAIPLPGIVISGNLTDGSK